MDSLITSDLNARMCITYESCINGLITSTIYTGRRDNGHIIRTVGFFCSNGIIQFPSFWVIRRDDTTPSLILAASNGFYFISQSLLLTNLTTIL